MPAPPGNELNAVSPEQKVELHRTCVRKLHKSVRPMQNKFDCRFPHNHLGIFPGRAAVEIQVGLLASLEIAGMTTADESGPCNAEASIASAPTMA
jgi:hypothetical protein